MIIPTKQQNYKDLTVKQPPFESMHFSARVIQAARLIQAKNDIRYYLNGICLHPDGYVYGTDGHVAIKIKADECKCLSDPVIISIGGTKIPAKVSSVEIKSLSSRNGVVLMRDAMGILVKDARYFDFVEGKYPDMDRIYNKKKHTEAVTMIGFNPRLMQKVAEAKEALCGKGCSIVGASFTGENGGIFVDVGNYEHEAEMIVMPARP